MKQDSSIKKRKKRNWGDIVFIISFIILPITYFLVFYIYVNLNSFLMGFQLRINGHTEWTLENFMNRSPFRPEPPCRICALNPS